MRLFGRASPPDEDFTPPWRHDGHCLIYPVGYPWKRPHHRWEFAELAMPAEFIARRRHLFEPPLGNHDPLSHWLLCRLMEEIPDRGAPIEIAEFGVGHGAILESLILRAEECGRRVNVTGFDTFTTFPNHATDMDLTTRDSVAFTSAIVHRPHATQAVLTERLASPAVSRLTLVAGNLLDTPPPQVAWDFVHVDVDTYLVTAAVLRRVINDSAIIVVDDYYQPSLPGVAMAVNDLCQVHHRIPVLLPDSFGVKRSVRSAWIARLMRLR